MLRKIVSGCQAGADIAAIDAAIAKNFPYAGWVPKGRKTEAGPLPERYKVQEMPTAGYPKRTEQNVIDSDGTVIFTHGKLSGGSDLTRKLAIKHNRPWLHCDLTTVSANEACEELCKWIDANTIETLNVAGRSASKDELIYGVVYEVISLLLGRCSPEAQA
ncbi:MAG: putative molybdenum carrier protein [Desulfobulbaceae bacterium]|nr:putative molybdenum carrier protein [Desulfobulbaceae bacterium]